MIPTAEEAFKLAQIFGATVLLVCLFMIVNNAAHAASEAINTRRSK